MLYVPAEEMTEAEQVCYNAGWATPLQVMTMRDALRKIAGGFWSKGAVDALILGDWHPAMIEAQTIAKDALALAGADHGPKQARDGVGE